MNYVEPSLSWRNGKCGYFVSGRGWSSFLEVNALDPKDEEIARLKADLSSLQSKYDLAASALEIVNEEAKEWRAQAETYAFCYGPLTYKQSIGIVDDGEGDGSHPLSTALSRAISADKPLDAYGRKE